MKAEHKNILFFILIVLVLIVGCSESSKEDSVTPTPEVPVVKNPSYSDQELLDKVQKDALRYFWQYAHPNSGLARERYHEDDPNNDKDIITIGGSGFGIMSLLVGIERGMIPRGEAITRLETALNFLEKADRFHGAWPHWLDGNTGKTIPFSTFDNGGDLVETSFLCQALICLREYFKNGTPAEKNLATQADELWKGVEWNWYTKGENALYWHWSPNYGWKINFKLEGYNECLVTYVLGASSPTYAIPNQAYHESWARNGGIVTGAIFFQIPVIFKHNGAEGKVGPMFWAHYSYLGLDPRGLTDKYANYWNLNENHAKAMYNYCATNPIGWGGYSEKCWGLTASYTRNSDGSTGYSAHQPNNDRGVISPTAAISNMPYTPTETFKFLRFLYEENATKYIGSAGPYDAISPHHNWRTPRYLAIDQGTIVPMVENYRTGFLWNLFMQAPEIKQGLLNLGFHSSQHGF